jgi:hypothetical protein
MSDEGFLRRWSRLKAEPAPAAQAPPPLTPPAPAPAAVAEPRPGLLAPQREGAAPALPTLDDVARLDLNSDFSAFVAKGVDQDVRRLAMKKLFADPHFNLIDRLDVYMDDYNKPSPVSAGMLAALHHTKNLFAPLAGADKEADSEASAEAGEGVACAAATDSDPNGAAMTASDPAAADAAPGQLEPTQFHGAASGGVLQQTAQGKA